MWRCQYWGGYFFLLFDIQNSLSQPADIPAQDLDTSCVHGAWELAPQVGLILTEDQELKPRYIWRQVETGASLICTIVKLLADFKHSCIYTDCSNHGNLCARGTGSKPSFVSTGGQSRHSWLQSLGSRNLSPARKGCLRHNLKWPTSLNFILASKLRHNPVVLNSIKAPKSIEINILWKKKIPETRKSQPTWEHEYKMIWCYWKAMEFGH